MGEKGNALGLLPIGVFLVLFLGMGILTGDFYAMPAAVAFLIALMTAFFQNRSLPFGEKMKVISQAVGDENIVTMCLIFLAAGAFSGTVTAAGGADSTVALGLSVMPPGIAVAGLMLIGCFMSISMGTSMGTIGTLAPIALGISERTGFSPALCIGAVVSGAMFGDNLSMISDTTIAAVRTQGCKMRDKFRENFLLVLPAALVSLVIYGLMGRGGSEVLTEAGSYNLWQVLPYLAVLAGALAGLNVFAVLIGGTVLSAAVGLGTGTILPGELFKVMGDGVSSMYDITVISILVACIVALVRKNGGIACILSMIHRRVRGKKGAELGIAALAAAVDLAVANNTVAIVIAGPIAKEISGDYGVDPKRSASLLDIFASAVQGLIPYGAQVLLAAGQSGLSPLEIIPLTFYPMLMGASVLVFILIRKR